MSQAGRVHWNATPRIATLAGAAMVTLALVAVGFWLARGDVSTVKALVPLWLAVLPVAGIGALAGWFVAAATSRSRGEGRPHASDADRDRLSGRVERGEATDTVLDEHR